MRKKLSFQLDFSKLANLIFSGIYKNSAYNVDDVMSVSLLNRLVHKKSVDKIALTDWLESLGLNLKSLGDYNFVTEEEKPQYGEYKLSQELKDLLLFITDVGLPSEVIGDPDKKYLLDIDQGTMVDVEKMASLLFVVKNFLICKTHGVKGVDYCEFINPAFSGDKIAVENIMIQTGIVGSDILKQVLLLLSDLDGSTVAIKETDPSTVLFIEPERAELVKPTAERKVAAAKAKEPSVTIFDLF